MTRKRIICVLDFLSGVRSGGLSGDLDRVDGGIHASTVWGRRRVFSFEGFSRAKLWTG